jgi:hypothetical protein
LKNLIALVVLGAALTASASDQPPKPAAGPTPPGGGRIAIKTPFRFQASGNYVFVINGGTANWTAALDVTVKCTPVAPTTTCAYPSMQRHYNAGEFPKGYGQSPASAPSGNSVVITQGGGYDAIFMSEAVGTYKFVATAANNASPEMPVTVTTPPPGSQPPIHVNPGAIQLAPTKPPARP